ncbi:hypothetical protein ACFFGT_29410 [Mucilaginibacter angelicae]|uniref:Uncharacterized protein n=1 Tax=Mucilaginibacter angelicae TaxID=869718 RepID=A0ABV6LFW1_9SPHI
MVNVGSVWVLRNRYTGVEKRIIDAKLFCCDTMGHIIVEQNDLLNSIRLYFMSANLQLLNEKSKRRKVHAQGQYIVHEVYCLYMT